MCVVYEIITIKLLEKNRNSKIIDKTKTMNLLGVGFRIPRKYQHKVLYEMEKLKYLKQINKFEYKILK